MQTTRLYCHIPTTTHRKTKAISSMNGIDLKDYVTSALDHYNSLMSGEEIEKIDVDKSLIKE